MLGAQYRCSELGAIDSVIPFVLPRHMFHTSKTEGKSVRESFSGNRAWQDLRKCASLARFFCFPKHSMGLEYLLPH